MLVVTLTRFRYNILTVTKLGAVIYQNQSGTRHGITDNRYIMFNVYYNDD